SRILLTPIDLAIVFPLSVPSNYRFSAWIFSFEENLAIKNAPPIVRLCLTIGVHFIISHDFLICLRTGTSK
ncbi:hypothetical protein P9X03_30220, partial [Bacillus cereus]|nr:hypothetical protein [Bacillus cereus]